jgi:hypothetical protein
MTADVGSSRGHADPCTLPLPEQKICSLRALTSLHPDVLASFRFLCSLIPHLVTGTYSLDGSPSYVGSLPNVPLHFSPVYFLEQQNRPFSVLSKLLFLSTTGSLAGNVRAQLFHSVQRAGQWKLRFTLPFLSCSLYNPKFMVSGKRQIY